MQDGGANDARYYAELLYEGIEEIRVSNVVQIVTDCASVMTASWKQLITCPEFAKIYFHGCLAHKPNILS